MANFRAITAVTDAIGQLLASQVGLSGIADPLEFEVYTAANFATPMTRGVSIFLYRIYPNSTQRTPPGRLLPNGRRQPAMLPLDLHFLLTAWAEDASLQHLIAAWMMRTLQDTPSLPAGLLNHRFANTFHDDETVEVAIAELTTEELFEIWEVVARNTYQLSVPYVARNVRIESSQSMIEAGPVQERLLDYRALVRE